MGRVMQISARNHIEGHPQKKKEVLYFVKKNLGEIGESSDQLSESESDSDTNVCLWHYKEQIRNIF